MSGDHFTWEQTWEEILAQDEWLTPPYPPGAHFAVSSCGEFDAVRDRERLRRRFADAEPEVAAAVLNGMWNVLGGWNLDRPQNALDLRSLAARSYVAALVEVADRDSSVRAGCEVVTEAVKATQAAWRATRGPSPTGPAELCAPVLVALDVRLPWLAESAFTQLLRAFRPPPGDVFSALVADGTPIRDAAVAAAALAG